MSAVKTVVIHGERIAWKDVLRLRREQLEKARKREQPALFELRNDRRPPTHKRAAGRDTEPTLFET
jgi:hypothetical protein